MVEKDVERINRLFQMFSKYEIDYAVGYDDISIRYFSGGSIDYSAVIVDVKRESLVGIINVMEANRVKRFTWLDDIIIYGGKVKEYKTINADNVFEALKKYFESNSGKIGISFGSITHEVYKLMEKSLGESKLIDISDLLWRLRMKKSQYEQRLISKAGEIVDYGIHESIKSVRERISENELAHIGRCSMYEAGADKVYDFLIVAGGENSSNPHWRASEYKIKRGDIITFDYVASYNGYYGDETRTVFYNEVSNAEFKKIYEIVLDAQVSAIDAIEPGVKASDIDRIARKVIENAGYGRFFIHSTGHGVGLDVHEKPRVSSKDSTILDEGYVITVEPGIYIPGIGGVRIEDMILVTSKGHKLLTKLNKALQVIED